jgi:hypothetical protein
MRIVRLSDGMNLLSPTPMRRLNEIHHQPPQHQPLPITIISLLHRFRSLWLAWSRRQNWLQKAAKPDESTVFRDRSRLEALLGRLPARCWRRVVARYPALNAFNGFAISEFGNAALRDFSTTEEFSDRKANLIKRYLGRCRNFAIEQLPVFF